MQSKTVGQVQWELLKGAKHWHRVPKQTWDPNGDFTMQVKHIDYKVQSNKEDRQVPVLRVFGVTEGGESCCMHVHGFLPYIYVRVPTRHQAPDAAAVFAQEFHAALEEAIKEKPMRKRNGIKPEAPFVTKVTLEQKCTIFGYCEPDPTGNIKQAFLKIELSIPEIVYACRDVLTNSKLRIGKHNYQFPITYESNTLFVTRFMVDKSISGQSWITLRKGTFEKCKIIQTTCAVEIMANHANLIVHAHDDPNWLKSSRYRVLSFDIECKGKEGQFPDAKEDPILMISSIVSDDDGTGKKRNFAVLFAVGTYEAIRNTSDMDLSSTVIHAVQDERLMLMLWRRFVIETDPDILTGYNISGFDLPYVIERAKTLNLHEFGLLGRTADKSYVRTRTVTTRAYGTRQTKEVPITGRIVMDPLQFIIKDHKLRSYKLNNVAQHFLQMQKDDVHHSQIAKLYEGSDADRTRLARYCLMDSWLVLRLLDKLCSIVNFNEQAKVYGILVNMLLNDGQQKKVMAQLLRKLRTLGFVIPRLPQQNVKKYKGATVIKPMPGFYRTPINTLDFASLYPSIMIAHNLCYTTYLTPAQKAAMDPNDYTEVPGGAGTAFVKAHVRKGILPMLLEELIEQRKKVKKQMAATNDPFMQMVFNGAQLAIKISANSIYGFTGAAGTLPLPAIAASVTAFGRTGLDITKEIVELLFVPTAWLDKNTNDFPWPPECAAYRKMLDQKPDQVGRRMRYMQLLLQKSPTVYKALLDVQSKLTRPAKVIYGDTDSTFVDFGIEDIATNFKVSQVACDVCNVFFLKPMKLEFEKTYKYFLLVMKKRYSGSKFEAPNAHKMKSFETRGLANVKRDVSELCASTMAKVLEFLVLEGSIEKAIAYVKYVIQALLRNEIDFRLLVLSKNIGKSDYKTKTVQQAVADKIAKRDKGQALKAGDRAVFVIVQGLAKDAKSEKAEEPLFAIENNVPIGVDHYLEELESNLTPIFALIMKKPSELFHGAHARTRVLPSLPPSGPLAKSMIRYGKCYGCHAQIAPNTMICKDCTSNKAELFYQFMEQDYIPAEQFCTQVWQFCHRCKSDRCVGTADRLSSSSSFKSARISTRIPTRTSSRNKQNQIADIEDLATSLSPALLCANNACPLFYARASAKHKFRTKRIELNSF